MDTLLFKCPVPKLKRWRGGNVVFVLDDSREVSAAAHPVFNRSLIHDDDALQQLCDEVRGAATAEITKRFNLEGSFNPSHALIFTDTTEYSAGSPAVLCIAILNPEIFIRLHVFFLELTALALLEPSLGIGDRGYYEPTKDVFQITASSSTLYDWRWRWGTSIEMWMKEQKSSQVLKAGVNSFRGRLIPVQDLWVDLRGKLIAFNKSSKVEFLDELVGNVDGTLAHLQGMMDRCDLEVGDLEKKELDPEFGLTKTNSYSSGIGLETMGNGLCSRTGTAVVGSNVLKKRRLLQKQPPQASATTAAEGASKALPKNLVILMLVVSVPPGIVATYLCEAGEEVPQYDSNFYSTACQLFLGLAGIVAIVAPIITEWWSRLWGKRRGMSSSEDEGIKTSSPILFYSLLVFSVTTLLASAAAYPYSPMASIPLGVAAGIAQNIATLLIIEDTGNTILEQGDKIEGLKDEINDLRRRR